jgi:hypothetical protein
MPTLPSALFNLWMQGVTAFVRNQAIGELPLSKIFRNDLTETLSHRSVLSRRILLFLAIAVNLSRTKALVHFEYSGCAPEHSAAD